MKRFYVLNTIVLVMILWASIMSPIEAFATTGDLDGDGDIDQNDLNILLADRNTGVGDSACGTPCDLDDDGMITALDARKLVLLCTRPRCEVESEENNPPVADAGEDQIYALSADQTAIDVTLDGRESNDLDGTIVSYVWTGTPDPDDIAQPTVSLVSGVYHFTLVVTDDDGAASGPDEVIVAILGIPELVPLPHVTPYSTVTVRGRTVPGAQVIIRGGVAEADADALSDSGFFEVPVELAVGENQFSVSAEFNGVESHPAEAVITRTQSTIFLVNVTPETGQSGSILDLTGSGFTAEKDAMDVYFKGTQQEAGGFVLEATETTMKVVVPFVFLNTDEEVQVYIYSNTEVSNSIPFHVIPAVDPTPAEAGNETSEQFGLLLVQIQGTSTKLEQLVKPYIPEEKWALLEENFRRMEAFVQNIENGLPSLYDTGMLSSLDAIFGSDISLLINQKLEQINELLSHSSYAEAACNVNEIISILNEIIDILDTWDDILMVAEVASAICCFLGGAPCCAAVAAIEVTRDIIKPIIAVLKVIRSTLNASVPSKPTKWRIDIENQFPGVDPKILYTETNSNTLSLYVDFTNGGFTSFVGSLSKFGGWILNLLDVNFAELHVDNVLVRSTVVRKDRNNSLLSIVNEGEPADTHTLITTPLEGSVELDIQATCGAYHYPDMIGESSSSSYPPYYPVDIISGPIINQITWASDVDVPSVSEAQAGWLVEGIGFSEEVEAFIGNYNETYDWLGTHSCAFNLTYNSFLLNEDCLLDNEGPFRFTMALKDIFGNERQVPIIYMPPKPGMDIEITGVSPSSGYIGDMFSVSAAHIHGSHAEDSQVFQDITLTFETASESVTIAPSERVLYDEKLFFRVPEELRDHMDESILLRLEVRVSPIVIDGGRSYDEAVYELRVVERAEWGDNDLIAFYQPNSYMRTAVVGDLDGDGENDLIVGIPEHHIDGTTAIGAVFIAFGPVDGKSLPTGQKYIDFDYGESDRDWDVLILGDFTDFDVDGNSRRIGNALAVRDINGDGITDLLIGSTDQNDQGLHRYNIILEAHSPTHRPGKAYVFYGRMRDEWQAHNGIYYIYRENPITGEVQEDPDIIIRGDNQRELGYQVALGNLNDDAYADIVISSPSVDPNAVNQGNFLSTTDTVYVIFGGNLLPRFIEMPSGWTHTQNGGAMIMQQVPEAGEYKGDGLGKSLTVGDVDGDGIDDLLLAAPYYSKDMIQGAAYLFYGSTTFTGILKVGPAGHQDVMFEGAIQGPVHIGDINNDGKGEIISSLQAHCSVAVWDGSFVPLHDGMIDLSCLHSGGVLKSFPYSLCIHSSENFPGLGAAITTADVNGDSIKDMVVGAPGGDLIHGKVWVLYGSESSHFLKRFGSPQFDLYYPSDIFLSNRFWQSPWGESPSINDHLIIGDQKHEEEQGFGTFIAVGDLSPYEGDDLLIIDPLAGSPNPPSMSGVRKYSGMLYAFYEGPNPGPMLSGNPDLLDFGTDTTEHSFTITNVGGESLSWSIKPNLPSWLSVFPMSGETASGESSTVTVNVKKTGLPIGNYIQGIFITSNGGEDVVAVSMEVVPSDLSIRIQDSPDPVKAGYYLKYLVKVTNHSPSKATDVNLIHTLPVNVELISHAVSQGTSQTVGGEIRCNLGQLESQESAILTVVVKTGEEGMISTTATITWEGTDPDPGNNSATETTRVKRWIVEHVDAGLVPSIAVDSRGQTHISYSDENYVPMYATYVEGEWISRRLENSGEVLSSSIAVDSNDRVHLVYYKRDQDDPGVPHSLLYTNNTMGFWQDPVIIVQNNLLGFVSLSMDLDTNDHVHIGYIGTESGMAGSGPLGYVTNASGQWVDEVISQGYSAYDHAALAVDTDNHIHISFYSFQLGGIVYLTNAPDGTWKTPELVEPDWHGGQMEGMVTDIAVDASNNPHISYVCALQDWGDEDIKYATKRNGQWEIQKVDDGTLQSSGNSIAVDSDNQAHLLYYHVPSGELKYAFKDNGVWEKETIDSYDYDLGQGLAVDSFGTIHMTYSLYDNGYKIRYSSNTKETDRDSDGISDKEEQGPSGDDLLYDGNGDQVPDFEQPNVVSFHTINGEYVTLACPDDFFLANVKSVENPSPLTGPQGVGFLFDFFEFIVYGLEKGQAVSVDLILPSGETADTYFKFGPTASNSDAGWYEFLYDGQTGATISDNVVTLHVIDGQRGDHDWSENGIIEEPGAPGTDGSIPAADGDSKATSLGAFNLNTTYNASPLQPILLELVPSEQEVIFGNPVEVDLVISGLGDGNAPSLGVFDLNITYDASVLAFSDYELGPYLGDILLTEALDLSWEEMLPCLINIAELSLLDATGTSGPSFMSPYLDEIQPDSFTLAILTFETLAIGTSPLDITINTLGDAYGDPLLDVVPENGRVDIIPEPGTLLLVVSGLAGLGLWRRKRL